MREAHSDSQTNDCAPSWRECFIVLKKCVAHNGCWRFVADAHVLTLQTDHYSAPTLILFAREEPKYRLWQLEKLPLVAR